MAIYEFPHSRNYEDNTNKLLMKIVERLDGITSELDNINGDISQIKTDIDNIKITDYELIERVTIDNSTTMTVTLPDCQHIIVDINGTSTDGIAHTYVNDDYTTKSYLVLSATDNQFHKVWYDIECGVIRTVYHSSGVTNRGQAATLTERTYAPTFYTSINKMTFLKFSIGSIINIYGARRSV